MDFKKLKKLNLNTNVIENIDVLEEINYKNLEILSLSNNAELNSNYCIDTFLYNLRNKIKYSNPKLKIINY